MNQIKFFGAALFLVCSALTPVSVYSEQAEGKEESKPEAKAPATESKEKEVTKTEPVKPEVKAEVKKVEEVANVPAHEGKCLASEEIIRDIEARENAIKLKEAQFQERENEIAAEKNAIKDDLARLELIRNEIQGIKGKALAEHEEKVNRLVETFESMSPKSAALVIAKVDEDLAVTALSKVSTAKAAKILAAMDATKSSHLSEMIVYGQGKSKLSKTEERSLENGESHQRSPANSR